MNFKKPRFWDYPQLSIIAYILLPFTILIILRNFFFEIIKKKKSKKIKTICVGNIYLGGTGKTPLTIKINEILENLGGKKIVTGKKEYTNHIDEELLLKKKTNLIIAKSRKEIINRAIKNEYSILIFDDGLQDIEIDYDLKFVCFKTRNWIGNGQLIPAGPMRERISSLKKFDAIFLNGDFENFENVKKKIKKINKNIKIFKTYYKIKNIQNFDLNLKYLIFSGIGNPNDFKEILVYNNFKISKEMIFSDHYNYKKNDLEKILKIAKEKNLKIITTEKDYVKISDQFKKNINFLDIELIIQNEVELINLLNKLT
jgi:tetraacyldisaccharide 4'-kinase